MICNIKYITTVQLLHFAILKLSHFNLQYTLFILMNWFLLTDKMEWGFVGGGGIGVEREHSWIWRMLLVMLVGVLFYFVCLNYINICKWLIFLACLYSNSNLCCLKHSSAKSIYCRTMHRSAWHCIYILHKHCTIFM